MKLDFLKMLVGLIFSIGPCIFDFGLDSSLGSIARGVYGRVVFR